MLHSIKLNHRFVCEVLQGNKRFEIRNNDRAYQKGDLIRFIVVDDSGRKYEDMSTLQRVFLSAGDGDIEDLEKMVFEITFVISGWGLKNGFVAFGFKEYES